ncbi:MAG: type II toxin-antitoxin system RelE/ParE family toxin [Gallionella sp.]|nr:type II toxin-antitoxin system RelE/ParE family toxin [Gallionella sp.]
MHTFIELPTFTRYAADYFSEIELTELQVALSKNPNQGDVVPGTRGVRKVRWARAGMGKRGGVRVLYYVQDTLGRIWLLTVYAKSARENIAASTLNALREIADHAEII